MKFITATCYYKNPGNIIQGTKKANIRQQFHNIEK